MGKSFTDNEVILVINNQSHTMSLSAQPISEQHILLELAPMDSQRRLSQEQIQQAQQMAARELVRGLAHEIKIHSVDYEGGSIISKIIT